MNVNNFGKLFTVIILLIFSISFITKAQINDNKDKKNPGISQLAKGFKTLPDSTKPSCYWYWLSDNISREGVTRDLESMAKVGIGRAFIGNIGLDTAETSYGKVKMFSDEWWKVTEQAMSTATKLGINIGLFNGPGWSQSGGPWITPDKSMRYIAGYEQDVTGPEELNQKLDLPDKNFQDVAVLAFPVPDNDNSNIITQNPKISSNIEINNLKNILDGDQNTEAIFPESITSDKTLNIDIEVKDAFTARSLSLYSAKKPIKCDCEFQYYANGEYKTIKKFEFDRSNPGKNVGFIPYGPVTISFSAIKAAKFRLVMTNMQPVGGLAEIVISGAPKVERYIEKQLAKMFQTPHPMWNDYQWAPQPEPDDPAMILKPSQIINITKNLSSNGELKWSVPEGNWKIIRFGMLPTGVTNAPATPEGRGLEVDKMSKPDIYYHFNSFIKKVQDRIPANERKTWKLVVEDSYETGSENWTDDFAKIFKENYGYDPLPWLPVFTGRIVGSADLSDRFLWDVRRLVADLIAKNYVGGLSEVSHKNGFTTWLENYGHWGYPGEFLMYGSRSDEVSGEFWAEGELGSIELRDASSAAHIYGKTKVSSESFTAAFRSYERYPAMLKKRGDWAFTEGINNTLFHVYITQPYEDKFPGVNAWFGTEFNRHNTWFGFFKPFVDYMRRCNYMLQQGKVVNDVAYFIGEDAPKMTGVRDPELPVGYSFDYINAEVIENRLSVKDGKLVLPDGMSYRMLVLPKLETMRPEVLKKIRDLVSMGAVVLGQPPQKSPSMQGYPQSDTDIKKYAKELWGKVDGQNVKYAKYGKGMIMNGLDMKSALNILNVAPDFNVGENEGVLFIHRKLSSGDIYFVTNQKDTTININPAFRVNGERPEFWDAVTGETRILPDFTENQSITTVPLKLVPYQSGFIVFTKDAKKLSPSGILTNFPDPKIVLKLSEPWVITFDPKMRGPENPVVFNTLQDWTKQSDDNIKYYSGTAVYSTKFNLTNLPKGEKLYLNLGNVMTNAKVKLNGVDLGGVWTPPWQVDITKSIKNGENNLEIEIANTWVNRIIGDLNLPESERKIWTNDHPYKADSPLQPAGLLGPVTVTSVRYN